MRLGGQDGWDEDAGRAEQRGSDGNVSLAIAEPHAREPLVLGFSLSPTSTALALFRGGDLLRAETVVHAARALISARRPESRRELRAEAVRAFLCAAGVEPSALSAIAVRADTLLPVESGTYRIDAAILREVAARSDNLAASVAHDVATEWGCPAFAVDPASCDERAEAARMENGAGEQSVLAMKAAARRHALAVDRPLESLRLVVVHVGAAVSVCVQAGARVGEVQEALAPAAVASELARARDGAEAGDGGASGVLHAMCTRVAKAIGGLATVLEGEVDAVLLTGALERVGPCLPDICRRVEWIAPVFLYRDEDELVALAHGALAVLRGDEPLKRYA